MSQYPGDSIVEPQSGGGGAADTRAGDVLSQLTHQYLDQTRPWVRFMSILTFVAAGLMAVAGLGIIAIGMVGGLAAKEYGAEFGAIGAAVVGLFYLLMAFLYTVPGVFLHRYAVAIRQLRATPTVGALEDALKHQKSFWRYVGILSAVAVAIVAIGVVLAIVFFIIGIMVAARR